MVVLVFSNKWSITFGPLTVVTFPYLVFEGPHFYESPYFFACGGIFKFGLNLVHLKKVEGLHLVN